MPLDRLYIRVQAVEEKAQRAQEGAEARALQQEAAGRAEGERGVSVRDTLRRLGEYFYRRGEVYQAEKRPDPVNSEQALAQHGRLVMMGAPGSGKSTRLRHLARRAPSDEQGCTPIMVSLREYATALGQDSTLSLHEFALRRAAGEADCELRRALVAEIEAGRALWLVDALDEARGWAAQAAAQIGQVKGQLALTSRPLCYVGPGGNLPEFEVLPLTAEQTDGFLERWFELLAALQGEGTAWGVASGPGG